MAWHDDDDGNVGNDNDDDNDNNWLYLKSSFSGAFLIAANS